MFKACSIMSSVLSINSADITGYFTVGLCVKFIWYSCSVLVEKYIFQQLHSATKFLGSYFLARYELRDELHYSY